MVPAALLHLLEVVQRVQWRLLMMQVEALLLLLLLRLRHAEIRWYRLREMRLSLRRPRLLLRRQHRLRLLHVPQRCWIWMTTSLWPPHRLARQHPRPCVRLRLRQPLLPLRQHLLHPSPWDHQKVTTTCANVR